MDHHNCWTWGHLNAHVDSFFFLPRSPGGGGQYFLSKQSEVSCPLGTTKLFHCNEVEKPSLSLNATEQDIFMWDQAAR